MSTLRTPRGHAPLDKPPVERWEQFDENTWDKEKFIVQLHRAAEEFQHRYPQIPISEDSQAGQHNLNVISNYLKALGVAGNSMRNLQAVVEAAAADFIYVPSAVGLSAEPATGANLIRQLTSEQWNMLVGTSHRPTPAAKTPTTFAEAKSLDDSLLSAEQYKAKHRKTGWADLDAKVQKAELDEMAKIYDQFLQLRPAFVRSDANANMLLEATQAGGGRISLSTLCATYDELVRSGRMKANTVVDRKENGVRMVNYAATDSPESVFPNQRAAVPEKKLTDAALDTLLAKIPSMSSAEYLRHLQTNKAFRDRVNALGR